MWYIGIDLHARTFTMVAMKEDGEVRFEQCWDTSSENLREAVEALSGGKQVVFEESGLASWAYRVLQPCGSVVVADPWHNRLIGEDEKCDDAKAARKLADLLRTGMIRAVHHTADLGRQGFKELVLMYHDACRDQTRAKNRLKGKFRQHGVRCSGRDVYRWESQEKWRSQLESREAQCQVELLWEDLDHAATKCERLRRTIQERARGVEMIRRFRAVPGIGLIRAATFYALVDTPHRFANKRKLWTYCGIGLAKRRSDQQAGPQHLTRRGNPHLKHVAKGAAVSAITAGHNPFADQHSELLGRGLDPALARLTVCRSIISTLYEMWRRGRLYDPQFREEARCRWAERTGAQAAG
jgi:transposase